MIDYDAYDAAYEAACEAEADTKSEAESELREAWVDENPRLATLLDRCEEGGSARDLIAAAIEKIIDDYVDTEMDNYLSECWDASELASDPYAYYGVSRRDF